MFHWILMELIQSLTILILISYTLLNNTTIDNIYLSWIDLNSTNLELKTIQQSIQSGEKKYFLIPVLESKSTEYLIQTSNDKSPLYTVYSNSSYSNINNKVLTLKTW